MPRTGTNSEMKIVDVEISTLSLDPANARKHTQKNLESIKSSLRKFQQQKPIVIDRNNVVVAGNGTVEAAKSLGWTSIKAVQTELTGAEAIAFAISDNRTSELAEWDKDVLGSSLQALREDGLELEDLGFDEDDYGKVKPPNPEQDAIEDDVPEVDEKEVWVKPGDLFQLGDHRLLCADCTVKENVDRLMGVQKADICFTSPPYNVGHNLGYKTKSKYINSNDNMKDYDKFLIITTSIFLNYCEYSFINLQFLANNKIDILTFLYHLKDSFCDIAYWKKLQVQPAMAKNVMNSQCENIFIFSNKSNNRAINTGDFHGNVSNFIETNSNQKDNESADIHNAGFPVSLATHFIETFSKNSVIDYFCGTGTTIIACEKTNRKAFCMEIDPHYCQIILERWAKYTNKTWQKVSE